MVLVARTYSAAMNQGKMCTPLRSGALVIAVLGTLVVGCSTADESGDGGPDTTSTVTAAAVADVDRTLSLKDGDAVATVDRRFQSYNVEMVEVTGGEFWKPYDSGPGKVVRPPIDLSSPKLRKLASALGPAYIRVSGTWANSTYFDKDGTTGGTPPAGYMGVLTGDQWKGVGEFANAVDGEVVTSFAVNAGTRDETGMWRDDQARSLMQFSVDNDVPLVAAEFYNEPGFNVSVPSEYDAASFERDFKVFTAAVDEVMPDLKLVGPGSGDDVTPIILEPSIRSTEILDRIDTSRYEAFSYHFYPKVSERCGSTEDSAPALTNEYLSRVEVDKQYYEELRDTYIPGAPMWITETAQAACGGDRWAAQYVDVIRYVDTLGRLATGDGDVVFHNTLASSDYGLIDEDGFKPRPNYWAAVLWQQLMGPEVLALKDDDDDVDDLAVYAHCTPVAEAKSPTVTYAVVNSSATNKRTIATASGQAQVYLLTADSLDSVDVSLNGKQLAADADGTIPELVGTTADGSVTVPPASVAFVVEATDATACAN